MKTKVLFLLSLLIFSIILFLLRDWVALAYQSLLLLSCSILLPATQKTVDINYESSLRLIPFLALLFATPRLGLLRRLLMALVGLVVFASIDLLIILVWQAPPPLPSQGQASFAHLLSSLIWDMLGHWILPFMLWLIAVHRQIGVLFMVNARERE